eukprot:1154320-Pelagomonas_calceolata.AAC.3
MSSNCCKEGKGKRYVAVLACCCEVGKRKLPLILGKGSCAWGVAGYGLEGPVPGFVPYTRTGYDVSHELAHVCFGGGGESPGTFCRVNQSCAC